MNRVNDLFISEYEEATQNTIKDLNYYIDSINIVINEYYMLDESKLYIPKHISYEDIKRSYFVTMKRCIAKIEKYLISLEEDIDISFGLINDIHNIRADIKLINEMIYNNIDIIYLNMEESDYNEVKELAHKLIKMIEKSKKEKENNK